MKSENKNRGKDTENMKTNKTWLALAVLLAVITAGAPLWAQSGEWPAWEGKNNADKTEWDEMGACWAGLMDAYRFLDNINVKAADDKRYAADVSGSAGAARSAANELRAYANKQKDGVKFWKKEKARFQAVLTKAQQVQRPLLAQIEAAEQAEKKAAEERQAAIARGVTEADFEYDAARDGKGVIITKYKGYAAVVNIPARIEGLPVLDIGSEAFKKTGISSVTIPAGVRSMGGGVFNECRDLASVVMPDSLSTIEYGTFENCVKLTTVKLPGTLKEIPDGMFSGCTALASITLPPSVTAIGGGAFFGCTALTSFTIPRTVTVIGSSAFAGSGLTSIVIPRGVELLGGEQFSSCKGLTSLTISSGVTEIPTNAFKDCTGLTAIAIPDSVQRIYGGAFSGCANLVTVTISPVNRWWEKAERGVYPVFGGCPKLSLASKAALNAAGFTDGF